MKVQQNGLNFLIHSVIIRGGGCSKYIQNDGDVSDESARGCVAAWSVIDTLGCFCNFQLNL